MFCTKCGSRLEDGAKFCTSCGAPTRFAQIPAPGAAEAVPPAPAAPAAPAAPVNAQPGAPQAPSWSAPAAQTPPQPTAPQQWQQPQRPQQQPWQQQPQQWQQPQQNWQQQQAQQQVRQPQQWQQPQQQWQQPAPGGAYAAPKKSGKGVVIGIIAAVLVVAVGVGGFVWPGFFRKSGSGGGISTALAHKFASPEDYFQAVETDNVEALAGHIASTYDNVFLGNAGSDDISMSGSVRFEPGDKVREMLTDALGEKLDEIKSDDDLKWFREITVDYDVSKKDDQAGIDGGLQLNGTNLFHINAFLRSSDGTLCLSVPELSDRYLQTTLEEMNLDKLTSRLNLGSLLSSLGNFEAEDAEKLDPVIDALPDAKLVETLLTKYMKEAVELVESVEKTQGTLTVDDISADYTVLISTVDPDTMNKIIQKLGPELKEDKDIRKIITDVATAAGEEPEAKYKSFTDKIDEYLNNPDKIKEDMKSDLVSTVYLDGSSKVHGRVLDLGDRRIELLMPEKGSQFGLSVSYTEEGTERLSIFGSGKRSDGKLTGDLSLDVDGEYYGIIGLDGFDIEKVKDGFLSGGMDLKFTPSVWTKLLDKANEDRDEDDRKEIPESLRSVLDTLVIHLDLNTGKDKANVTVAVTNGSEKLFTLAVDSTKGAAKKITPAEGIDGSEWAKDITLDKLEKVVASLEKAGLPTEYTDRLDEALDNAFD